MAKKSNGRGTLRLYRSYNYVDKDPAIDKLRTVFQDEGMSEKNLSILSGVAQATINNWFGGKTRRPQHTTLAAAAAAMGFDWELQQSKTIDYEAELPKAMRWQEKQQTQRAALAKRGTQTIRASSQKSDKRVKK